MWHYVVVVVSRCRLRPAHRFFDYMAMAVRRKHSSFMAMADCFGRSLRAGGLIAPQSFLCIQELRGGHRDLKLLESS